MTGEASSNHFNAITLSFLSCSSTCTGQVRVRGAQSTAPPSIMLHHSDALIDRKNLHGAYTEVRKQKSHSEEWLKCLILLVPPNGIEPLPDDYKASYVGIYQR